MKKVRTGRLSTIRFMTISIWRKFTIFCNWKVIKTASRSTFRTSFHFKDILNEIYMSYSIYIPDDLGDTLESCLQMAARSGTDMILPLTSITCFENGVNMGDDRRRLPGSAAGIGSVVTHPIQGPM